MTMTASQAPNPAKYGGRPEEHIGGGAQEQMQMHGDYGGPTMAEDLSYGAPNPMRDEQYGGAPPAQHDQFAGAPPPLYGGAPTQGEAQAY